MKLQNLLKYLDPGTNQYQRMAKNMLRFGLLTGLLLPPYIYFKQLHDMNKMESGILDDLERIRRKGKTYKDIPKARDKK